MAAGYVDDHRFWLYREGASPMDITNWVGSPESRDELEALSVELIFSVVRNQLYDPLMTWPGVAPGNKLKVVNHGREVFSGTVITVGLDGSVSAYDPPEAILQDILAICSAETGKSYKRRVKGGALTITELPQTPMVAYHKPASNLAAFDVTLAKGTVSGQDSMDGLINSVVLAGDGEDGAQILGRAHNPDSQNYYGLLQQVERLGGDENTAQARQRLRSILNEKDRLTIQREVGELWGADEVESGVLLQFQSNQFGERYCAGPRCSPGCRQRRYRGGVI